MNFPIYNESHDILSDLSSTAQNMHLQKHITFEPKLNELQVVKGCPWCNHRYCKEQSSQTTNCIHKNIECKLIWPLTFSSSTCTISVQFLSSTSVAFKGLTLTATLNKDNHTDINEQTLIQGWNKIHNLLHTVCTCRLFRREVIIR